MIQWAKDNCINFKSMSQVQVNVILSTHLTVKKVRDQLETYYRSAGLDPTLSCGDKLEQLRKCVVSGFFSHVATLQQDRTYRTLGTNKVRACT